jgi:GTP-binding protein Era
LPHAGFVALVGRPNAGKSTLLNALVGEHLAITSPKPQSTRERVVGILTRDDAQLILLDTPGLLEPRYALHHAMRRAALDAIADADVIAYLHDATTGAPPDLAPLAGLDAPPRAPVVHVLTKADLVPAEQRAALAAAAPDAVWVAAPRGDGLDTLVAALARHLPESPFLYPADDLSTQQTRFFVAEFVREAALARFDDEVPYSVACVVEEFREDRSPVYIRAVVYVERDTQKRILIGTGGAGIRDLGRDARQRVEALLGTPVYLDLWVKVQHNWRRDPHALARFGFRLPDDRAR